MRVGAFCYVAFLVSFVVLLLPAHADPSDLSGGVFIAHAPPNIQYSPGYDWCERYQEVYAISSCEEQNPRIDLDGTLGERSVWYVIAAWAEEKEWCTAEFGLGSFDPAIYAFLDWGACPPNDLEISTTNWPGPNQGMAVVATDTQWEGNFKAVYYFSGYAYYPGTISISEDPGQEFVGFGNCGAPSEQWSAHETGTMGISGDGVAVCPEECASGDPVPCCIGGSCSLLLPDECALAGGVVLSELSMCTEAACVSILPPEDPFEVLPSTINPLEECWTVLVRGIAPDSLTDVYIAVGQDEFPLTLAYTEGSTSSLWSGSIQIADTTASACTHAAGILQGNAVSLTTPLSWVEPSRRSMRQPINLLFVTVQPGVMGYMPGPRRRSLCELDQMNADMRRLFEEIGVAYVEKPIPHKADTVTVVQKRDGQWYDVLQPSPYRMYFLYLQSALNICPPAVIEILLDTPYFETGFAERVGGLTF